MINKPRKWWVAGLLSFFEPGLGQIYNGQARKGIWILLIPLFFLPLMLLFINSVNILYIIIICVFLAAIYYILVIGDAIHTALKFKNEYRPKKYNQVIAYIGIVVFIYAVNTATSGFVKSNIVKAYRISAGSNEPTLLVGDHVLTDMRTSARNPERFSLIVFEFPEDPTKDYVKRVVGIGGDTVEIRNKVLLINNKPVKEKYIIHEDPKQFSADRNPRDNFGPITVPESTCFVLGDNRDQSYDSRFWGVVENSKIKGTVKSIYWSWDRKNFTVRWNRIGKMVQ